MKKEDLTFTIMYEIPSVVLKRNSCSYNMNNATAVSIYL